MITSLAVRLYFSLAVAFCALTSLALAQQSAHGPSSDLNPQILNSERIEAAFGSFGIDLLRSDEALRVSNLYSGSSSHKVTRTYAIVKYPRDVNQALATEHALILEGGSIGATFRQHDWDVIKTHRFFGEIPSSDRLIAVMGGVDSAKLAIHIYVLDVAREGIRFEYAAIAEIHHPDFLSLQELTDIYAPDWPGSEPRDPLVWEMLGAAIAETR